MFTRGYGGRRLHKTITLYSNDPNASSVNLSITGRVDSFVEISPQRVTLNGQVGQPLRTAIRIQPRKEFPFRILGARAHKGDDITFTLEQAPQPAVDGYVLLVENRRKDAGRFWDRIDLKTDSEIQPMIRIPIYGHIRPVQTREQPEE